MAASFDVIIAGAGVVGAALAAALGDLDLDVAVVAPALRDALPPTASASRPIRPIALSLPSRDVLQSLALVGDQSGTPIRSIHVSQRGRFGRTVLNAADHQLPALGFVFDAAALEHDAHRAIAPVLIARHVISWSGATDRVHVTVQDDEATRSIDARLLVLADGGALAGLDMVHDYQQVAWTGTVRTTRAHANIAYERFTREGPLALLPLGDRYAFVWASARIDPMPVADDAFCAALESAFGERLGHFDQVSARSRLPLALKRAQRQHGPRVVTIGNAAQTLHPVAGQGLNLGLRDAIELARAIRSTPRHALGDAPFVEAFRRQRWPDRTAAIASTDLFARVFSDSGPIAAVLGGLGLAALDAVPHARGFLARRMILGTRGMP